MKQSGHPDLYLWVCNQETVVRVQAESFFHKIKKKQVKESCRQNKMLQQKGLRPHPHEHGFIEKGITFDNNSLSLFFKRS